MLEPARPSQPGARSLIVRFLLPLLLCEAIQHREQGRLAPHGDVYLSAGGDVAQRLGECLLCLRPRLCRPGNLVLAAIAQEPPCSCRGS